MKTTGSNLGLLGIILALFISLTSCSHPEDYQAQFSKDYSHENWMQQINLNPNVWTKNADPWFFTSETDLVTQRPVFDPVAQEMAAKPIRIPEFDRIHVTGNYQIQIIGHQAHNSITVVGPESAKRLIRLEIHNNTLYIHPIDACQSDIKCPTDFNHVIIRIGVCDLHSLIASGNNSITGKNIYSTDLSINASNNSHILLNGDIRLTNAKDSGCATITVLGITTPCLYINAAGCGTVNLAGRIGVKSIATTGNSNVNIIGAYSSDLSIFAHDNSSTKIAGVACLRKIIASDHSRVYMYWVNARCAIVKLSDQACVGLAGYSNTLNVNADGSSAFLGKCLTSGSIFIKTYGSSHANVAATTKIFASASDNSSIYYFGSPAIITRFVYGNATIIPVWTSRLAAPPVSQLDTGHFEFKYAVHDI